MKSLFSTVLAYIAIANAAPSNPKDVPGLLCVQIKGLLGSNAVPVCKAYLGCRTTTTTVTATTFGTSFQTRTLPVPTQTTTLDVTTTVYITSQITRYDPAPTTTQTTTVAGSTSTIYTYSPPQQNKRTVIDPALRNLEKKHAKAIVSAACSCVYNPTTKRVTKTATATQSVTRSTTKQPASTKVVTSTVYKAVTERVDVTKSLGPTSTVTAVATATVASAPVTARALCNVRGLPGDNTFNYDAIDGVSRRFCMETCRGVNACLATAFFTIGNHFDASTTGTCLFFSKSVTESAEFVDYEFTYFWDKACPVDEK